MIPITRQQTLYAVYGSNRSFYGNIGYSAAPQYVSIFGAWPDELPRQKGMVTNEPVEAIETIQPVIDYQTQIHNRISLIKELKRLIDAEDDLRAKNELRERLREERKEKENLFRLKALVDEEEAVFLLLH